MGKQCWAGGSAAAAVATVPGSTVPGQRGPRGPGVERGTRETPHTQKVVDLGGPRMATPGYPSFYILEIVLSFPVSVQ